MVTCMSGVANNLYKMPSHATVGPVSTPSPWQQGSRGGPDIGGEEEGVIISPWIFKLLQ